MVAVTSTHSNWLDAIVSVARRGVGSYGLLVSLAVIVLFFQTVTSGVLLQPLNVTNLLLQNSYVVIMALGMLMVIVCGHIDLSIGSIVGVIGALAGTLMARAGVDPITATLVCLAVGAAIGAAQGYWIAFWGMPSFIVTLAGMLVFRGATIAVTGGQAIGPFPSSFRWISAGFLPNVAQSAPFNVTAWAIGILVVIVFLTIEYSSRQGVVRRGGIVPSFAAFCIKNGVLAGLVLVVCGLLASYRGIPTVMVIMSALAVIYTFVMNRTVIGRRVYAVGGSLKAARLSGVSTARVTFFAFVNMGILSAVAGLIFAARLNSATPRAGTGFELDVIAAVFVGGASASGGAGTVLGAIIGASIMGVLNNGMSITGIGVDYQQMIKGFVLLAAVFVDIYQKNRA